MIYQVYPDSLVECLGICSGFNVGTFLSLYVSGQIPNCPSKIGFNLCYNATEVIAEYGFYAPSTWVIFDQTGKVVFREDDNTDPIMIDLVIEQIEGLL
jgi:hypothetical protein